MIKKIIVITFLPFLCVASAAQQPVSSSPAAAVSTAQATPTAATTPASTPSATARTQLGTHNPIDVLAAFTMPLASVTDAFTLGIFKEIDATFGPKGLNLEALQIQHAKNCYLYLIFTTKLEAVNTKAQFKQFQSAFMPFFQDNGTTTPHLPTAALLQSPDWSSVTISAQDITNSLVWQLFCKSMVADIYAYFSTALKILFNAEKQEFNYLPHFETSYYNQDYVNLRTLNASARTKLLLEQHACAYFLNQIPTWKKLPHIYEVASQQGPQQPKVAQPKGAKAKTSQEQPATSLEEAIVNFRHSPFYQTSHNIAALTGTSTAAANAQVTLADVLQGPKLNSPIKEFIFAYFMLYELYGQISNAITSDNLSESINTLTTSTLVPSIMPYSTEDFVLLNALLAQKSKSEGTHKSSIHPSPKTFVPEDFRKPEDMLNPSREGNETYMKRHLAVAKAQTTTAPQPEVKAQWFWDAIAHWVSHAVHSITHAVIHVADDVAHDVVKGYNDVKNGVEAAAYAVKDTVVGAAEGLAGAACDFAFFIPGATAEGNRLDSEAQHNLAAASNQLQDSINDFADAVKCGVDIYYGEITGALVGFITQDQAIGNDISSVIDSTAGAIIQIGAQMADAAGQQMIGGVIKGVDEAATEARFAALIASGAVAIFDKQERNDFLEQWHSTLSFITQEVTNAYTIGMTFVKSSVATAMNAIGAVMNSVTTIFIDLSREITFVFMTVGDATVGGIIDAATGQKYDPIAYGTAAANTAYTKLNNHRETINMTMGIVFMVVADPLITFFTAGAGTGAEVALDSAIIAEASVSAVEVAADAVATTTEVAADATEAATADVAADAANDATEDVADNTDNSSQADKGTKDSAKGAKDAAKGAKDAAKGAKDAAKGSKDAAKGAKDAAKDVDSASKADKDESPAAKEEAKAAKDKTEQIKKQSKAAKVAMKGLSTAGQIMNVVFNSTMLISGYNQDEQNILQQIQQEHELQNLWNANTQSKLSSAQAALAELRETSLKQQAAIGNNTLGLALYQNYTYAFLNDYRQNILTALAPMYIEQLLPDSTTQLLPGNIGTPWGIVSNFLDLYPSQSFYTTTKGRSDFPFGQEVAQAPQIATQQGKTTVNKEWFNQRCIAVDRTSATGKPNLATDPLHVKIDLQILYVLDSEFYTGIYMGGHYHDYASPTFLASLLNTTPNNTATAFAQLQQAIGAGSPTTPYLNPSVIDLDETDLAKMVILYRTSATDTLKIGVYESLGPTAWIMQEELPASVQLSTQHTYHLEAILQGDSLQVNLLVDNSTTPVFTKTVAVTKIDNQRMYGIISSGAAITWNQQLPAITLPTNSTARPATKRISEIDRDKQARVNQVDNMNPKFGSFKLTPLSKQAILFNQYVYASPSTDLKLIAPSNSTDFLIFATNNNGTISNFGKAPNSTTDSATNVLVSLITNHVFDNTGKIVKIAPNSWSIYQGAYGPFSAKLGTYIASVQQNIQTTLSKISFGQFALDIINPAALTAGSYIYTCTQTIQENSAPVTDYLICTTLPTTKGGDMKLGLPPTAPNAQALLSLVTGNLYDKTTTITPSTPPKATSTYDVFTEFEQFVTMGNIAQADYSTIQAAQLAYVQSQAQAQAAAQASAQPKPLDITKLSSIQPLSSAQLAPKPVPTEPTPTVFFGFSPPAQNIATKQQQAAGTVKFQPFTPTPTPAKKPKVAKVANPSATAVTASATAQ